MATLILYQYLRIFVSNPEDLPFAPQGDDCPVVPILVRLLLHLCRERYSTHDTVPELLVQYRLVCIAIILHDLVKTVDQWFSRWHIHNLSSERIPGQLFSELPVVDAQDLGEFLNILWYSLGLAVENSCHSHLVAPELLRDIFEGHILGCFGFEKDMSLHREAVSEGALHLVISVYSIDTEGDS